jgi:hypothetical protein
MCVCVFGSPVVQQAELDPVAMLDLTSLVDIDDAALEQLRQAGLSARDLMQDEAVGEVLQVQQRPAPDALGGVEGHTPGPGQPGLIPGPEQRVPTAEAVGRRPTRAVVYTV